MHNAYEPNEKYVERLEWQLASEYRRMDRTKAAGKIAVSRRLVATAVTVGVLLTGVAAIKAADVIKDSWRKKIELARAETQVKLKTARLESLRQMAARTESLVSSGLVREEEYRLMTIAGEKAVLDLEKSRLNLDEVNASGLPPNDELHAPLEDGRDFVSERLSVDIKVVEGDLEALVNRWKRFDELLEKGLVQADDQERLRAEIDARRRVIDGILKRIDLRKRFVAGEITARDIEIKDRMSVAETNLSQAKAKVAALKAQLERLASLAYKGMVSSRESGMLRLALDEAEAELKLAALEVEVLGNVK